MARGLIRKPSFTKIVGAYRSQWKRFWLRLFTFGLHGRRGMGWLRNPKKAWYNFWYYRSSISMYRILGVKPSRLSCFFALLIASATSLVSAPIDATGAAITANKIKKARRARVESASQKPKSAVKSESVGTKASGATSPTSVNKQRPATKPQNQPTLKISRPPVSSVQPEKPLRSEPPTASVFESIEAAPVAPKKAEASKEPDENTPKSKPKNERDQYIRKRMTVAGSSYCDQTVISRLSVGSYIDLQPEPENPYDKNAIALLGEGGKIGYIAQDDVAPFSVSIKLKREIYGVITDIREAGGRKEIEYETWFACKK